MANQNDEAQAQEGGVPAAESRVAFERLRERTDELELIISGISLVALATLPGWLFDQWVRVDAHVAGGRGVLIGFGFPLAIGLCYSLAAAFLIHLVARAYWVGLIGLKSVFPQGVRWDRVTSHGPLMREWLHERLADLGPSIDASDRFASTVFAIVSLVTLSILWLAVPLVALNVLADFVGRFVTFPDWLLAVIVIGFFSAIMLMSLLILVLDRHAGSLRARGREPSPALAATVRSLIRVQGLFYPQRLLLPIQLILESNLPKRTFSLAFAGIIAFTAFIGSIQLDAARTFTVVGQYDHATSGDVATGLRTAHYENLRAADDFVLRVPMIPSDLVADPYLRLFLPYLPSRDNQVLAGRCQAGTDAAARRACVAALWTVTLDGAPVDVGAFDFAERRDLGLRGLQGYVPTGGLLPGRHELVIAWKSRLPAESQPPRDRDYRIPFWFAPPYQLEYTPPVPAPDRADTTVPQPPAAPSAGVVGDAPNS